MIQQGSYLRVSDNSGAKEVYCIKVIKKKVAMIGDIIKVSVKKVKSNTRVNKGDMYYALVVKTKYGIRRHDGFYLKFMDNSVVLLNDNFELIGTRIFGVILKELKYTKVSKILSFCSYTI